MNLLMTCLILLLSLQASSCTPCKFPAIINFGDSNSDTGGLFATFDRPSSSPYGETFFHMLAGRYSDGRLIIDFIAESFGLAYLSAYLDSLGTNFSHGANFATAGSTIMQQSAPLNKGGYSPFSLDVQLLQFSHFKSRFQMISKKGKVFKSLMPKKDYFKRALYTIDIGQNDLTELFFSNQSADDYIPLTMKVFREVVKEVYKHGGRHFWIHNTGPLGCLAYALIRRPSSSPELDSVGCAVIFNKLAQKLNNMLNETVTQLRKNLPSATFIYVDVYSAKYKLFSNAEKHGFEIPLRTCCGYGGGDYNFDLNVMCGDKRIVKACSYPDKSIIWDGAHYTETANKWVFNEIATGKYSHPSLPLSQAC
ncbi:LOW QUALITY PROTEIN: GDSL esterase/lipase ACHE-like [Dioscorea cayenensis subsp. rotundata]|uniref:LOW QUALITY PROTEIN: GDSL esterase/lipase ACHE-like n=1 Tax=Dioscorea cayennensis subsp. rotundata TaxID=55577 RepID=A0AB40CGU9_DIOCR|nr:LOW QUALITY PROTEIN: GDSL esterase/lipase ACHE-like [Dioscorea cayenensis subsp. rotundata]